MNLDSDVYAFAQAYAGGKGISISSAISELVRRAEQVRESIEPTSRVKMGPHGYLVITGNGVTVTPEMVKEAAEDELV